MLLSLRASHRWCQRGCECWPPTYQQRRSRQLPYQHLSRPVDPAAVRRRHRGGGQPARRHFVGGPGAGGNPRRIRGRRVAGGADHGDARIPVRAHGPGRGTRGNATGADANHRARRRADVHGTGCAPLGGGDGGVHRAHRLRRRGHRGGQRPAASVDQTARRPTRRGPDDGLRRPARPVRRPRPLERVGILRRPRMAVGAGRVGGSRGGTGRGVGGGRRKARQRRTPPQPGHRRTRPGPRRAHVALADGAVPAGVLRPAVDERLRPDGMAAADLPRQRRLRGDRHDRVGAGRRPQRHRRTGHADAHRPRPHAHPVRRRLRRRHRRRIPGTVA